MVQLGQTPASQGHLLSSVHAPKAMQPNRIKSSPPTSSDPAISPQIGRSSLQQDRLWARLHFFPLRADVDESLARIEPSTHDMAAASAAGN